MAFLFHPGALLGAASGLTMAVLGVTLLRLRPRRTALVAFAAFATLWGLSVVAANLAQMAADAETGRAWLLVNLGLLIPVHVPLVAFVLVHPRRLLPSNALIGVLALLALPAGVLLLLLASAPDLFVVGAIERAPSLFVSDIGPLFLPVSVVNSLAVFAFALGLVTFQRGRIRSGHEDRQLALLQAAFLMYVSYQAANALVLPFGWADFLPSDGRFTYAVYAIAVTTALVLTLGMVVDVLRRRAAPYRVLIVLAGTLPLAIGVLESMLFASGIYGFSTVGIWRLAMVGLFAYAMARHRLFDLELRMAHATPVLTYAAVALAGLFVLASVVGPRLWAAGPFGPLGVVGLLLASAPLSRVLQARVRRGTAHMEDPDYLYQRKVAIYQSALEDISGAEAHRPEDDELLATLRRQLGISDDEHRLLVAMRGKTTDTGWTSARSNDRFQQRERLGDGSFGEAMLAYDRMLEREVVIKRPLLTTKMDDSARELFLREARLGARINHPNVVTLHEILHDEEHPALVFEHVSGGDLRSQLKAHGPYTREDALALADGILAGLQAVHDAGILHRDLKPANVLLDAEGTPKIGDFGVATLGPSEAAQGTLVTFAATNVQPGSLAYMSPEQARGEPLDERSDVYAAAAVIYELFVGEHYLGSTSTGLWAMRTAILEQAPRLDVSQLSTPVANVLAKALAKQATERYPTAAALRGALASVPK